MALPTVPSNCRQWKLLPQLETNAEHSFTIASYNILSEELLKRSSYFNKIQPEYWNRDARHAKLLKELDSLNADILCLQEVDKPYWMERLEPDLRRRGYTTTRSSGSWRQLPPVEGVVTCALEATFAELQPPLVGHLSDLVEARIEQLVAAGLEDSSKAALLAYVDAPQRYHIAQFVHRSSGQQLVVGNAHISYQRPAKPDLRAAQAVAIVSQTAAAASSSEAFLVCGDFNSTPDSMAYRSVMMTSPLVETARPGGDKLESFPLLRDAPELFGLNAAGEAKSVHIRSANHSVFGREPNCTLNLTNNSGCVDFIFYDTQRLRALAALEVPFEYILRDKDCVPDANMASDHLSIAAKFSFVA